MLGRPCAAGVRGSYRTSRSAVRTAQAGPKSQAPRVLAGAGRTSAAIMFGASREASRHATAGLLGPRAWGIVVATKAQLRAMGKPRVTTMPVGARRIAMLTISQIDIDPRINKVAASLADSGYTVEVLCFDYHANSAADDQVIEIRPGVSYVKVPVRQSYSMYFQQDLLRIGRQREFDAVHVNDLTTGVVGWLLAREFGVPLIYDAHEMWTENVESRNGQWVALSPRSRWWSTKLEKVVVRDAAIFVTVSPSIQREYLHRYSDVLSEAPLLLANYPSLEFDRPSTSRYADELGLPDDAFVVLYLGGVNPLRNIANVIAALEHLPERFHFVVQGPGSDVYEREFNDQAASIGVADRVHILPGVGRDDVVARGAGADCGIVMLQNVCLNFYWFFPNKLFEYALAGVPIAVSNFPDVSVFVERERCGVTFDPHSPESIAAALEQLGSDTLAARAMGANGRRGVLREHNWERAVQQLVGAYRRLECDADA